MKRFKYLSTIALLALGLFLSPPAVGQDTFDASAFGQSDDVFGGISFGGLSDAQQEPVTWSAKYFTSGDRGRLEIEAVVGRSWHIYSTTQPAGGPLATKFAITSPKSVSISGKFESNEPPTKATKTSNKTYFHAVASPNP